MIDTVHAADVIVTTSFDRRDHSVIYMAYVRQQGMRFFFTTYTFSIRPRWLCLFYDSKDVPSTPGEIIDDIKITFS